MNVRVKLFAAARELSNCDELTVNLPEGAKVSDLQKAVVEIAPALGKIIPHAMWAVGAEYAAADMSLNEQSEVALIPPVSGG
jgi:molybdopterin converting factor subunit 1